MQRIVPFFLLLLVCCKEPSIQKPKTDFKDSLITEYLAQIDSLESYDTTNYDFRVLRSYFKNDSIFFNEWQKDIEVNRKAIAYVSPEDSCTRLQKLSMLDVDEAYRFRHSEAFCFYKQIVTISRKTGSISLDYLEYSGTDDGNVIEYFEKGSLKKIGPGCKIEKKFSKRLSNKEWEIFEEYLAIAGYWGLKPHNPRLGLDGSSWHVDAYTKRPKYITGQQIHSVYRWSPINSFAELGRMFMKLADEKSMCGGF